MIHWLGHSVKFLNLLIIWTIATLWWNGSKMHCSLLYRGIWIPLLMIKFSKMDVIHSYVKVGGGGGGGGGGWNRHWYTSWWVSAVPKTPSQGPASIFKQPKLNSDFANTNCEKQVEGTAVTRRLQGYPKLFISFTSCSQVC